MAIIALCGKPGRSSRSLRRRWHGISDGDFVHVHRVRFTVVQALKDRDAFQFLWVERVRPRVVHDPGEPVERYFELHSFPRRRHVLRIK